MRFLQNLLFLWVPWLYFISSRFLLVDSTLLSVDSRSSRSWLSKVRFLPASLAVKKPSGEKAKRLQANPNKSSWSNLGFDQTSIKLNSVLWVQKATDTQKCVC